MRQLCPIALARTWSQGRWELRGRSGVQSLAGQLRPAARVLHEGGGNWTRVHIREPPHTLWGD